MADAHTHVSKLPRILYRYEIAAIEIQACFSLFLRHAFHFSGIHGETMCAHTSDPEISMYIKRKRRSRLIMSKELGALAIRSIPSPKAAVSSTSDAVPQSPIRLLVLGCLLRLELVT